MTSLPRTTRSAAPPTAGMVHIGPHSSGLHRPCTDEAIGAGSEYGEDSCIAAVSLKSPTAREVPAPQGFYNALERGPDGDVPRQVAAITDVLVAPEDPKAVLDAMTRPEIKIVSLTITEKDIAITPRNGCLSGPTIRMSRMTSPQVMHRELLWGSSQRCPAAVRQAYHPSQFCVATTCRRTARCCAGL